jgi:SAM-dependent methyltransferase
MTTAQDASAEIADGDRFAFGENWSRFLELVDDERIAAAEESLRGMLGVDDLRGRSFVDVGCGSGLFSLAAANLGASVTSFDFDLASVGCALELKRRYRGDDDRWVVVQGSALDVDFLRSLGAFDVVYSWGVLHHTGDMWAALANVETVAAPEATLFISIYNDQGFQSRLWTRVKRKYNSSGQCGRKVILELSRIRLRAPSIILGALFRPYGWYRLRASRRSGDSGHGSMSRSMAPKRVRGMDAERDLVDWVGGWPFEVATPEAIFGFFRLRGWELRVLKTCRGGLGCNEFVFER